MTVPSRFLRLTLGVSLVCAIISPTEAFAPDIEKTLKPEARNEFQRFGASVAVDGLVAAVGAPGEQLDPEDPSSPVTGAVHIYQRVPAGWQPTARLVPPENTTLWSEYGFAVALEGNTLVVGAHQEATLSTGGGAVYVYRRSDGEWLLEQILRPEIAQEQQTFGAPVAISGDRIVVGVKGEVGTKSSGRPYKGAAYVFRREGTGWVRETRLVSPSLYLDESFGWWVDIDANTVVVGAPDASIEIPVDDIYSRWIPDAGLAYVYTLTESGWSDGTLLMSQQPMESDGFGRCVAIEAEVIAVGAPQGGQIGRGAVEVFRQAGEGWIAEALLEPDDALTTGRFGFSLAVQADELFVGAPSDSEIGDVVVPFGGSVYAFERTVDGWAWQLELAPAERSPDAEFGSSVAFDGRSLIAGYPYQVPSDCQSGCWDQGAVQAFEQNRTPVADASETEPNVLADNGEHAWVELDGSASEDGDLDILNFAWFEEGRLLAEGGAFLDVLLDVGVHTLVLVVDDGRSTDTATWVVEVTAPVINQPPVAQVDSTEIVAFADASGSAHVRLDGSSSYDPDGDSLSFAWFLDGAPLSEQADVLVDLPVGHFSALLQVSDPLETASVVVEIEVLPLAEPDNAPPVADASATIPWAIAGLDGLGWVRLDASLSEDPDGDPLSFVWFWEDEPLSDQVIYDLALPVGLHDIVLRVDDGSVDRDTLVTVEVISASEAVLRLMQEVEAAELSRGRRTSTLAQLDLALRDLNLGQARKAAQKLRVFQKLLRAGHINPATTEYLSARAQAILDVLVW